MLQNTENNRKKRQKTLNFIEFNTWGLKIQMLAMAARPSFSEKNWELKGFPVRRRTSSWLTAWGYAFIFIS